MTDAKIREELTNAKMAAKIQSGLVTGDSKRKMSAAMSSSLRGQVEAKTREIQYAIESR